MSNLTQVQIAQFLEKKETNLCAWAKDKEHNYTTVFNTVNRWAGRDRRPHGGIARAIMKELHDDYLKYCNDTGSDNADVA